MADSRLDREVGKRENFQRVEGWTPPQTLPTPKPIAGWKFRWIRVSLMGTPDVTNTSSKHREGWIPVKAEDHPEIMHVMASTDPNARYKDNIEVGGLLLCKCPDEFLEQRKAYFDKQTRAQIEAVDNSFLRQRDSRSNMELFKDKESKSSVTFGRGSKSS